MESLPSVDVAPQIASDLSEVHQVLTITDKFYRYYRKALLHGEEWPERLYLKEWIPLPEH